MPFKTTKSKIKIILLSQFNDKIQKKASLVLNDALKNDKRIGEVLEVDLWSILKIKVPPKDPYFAFNTQDNTAGLIKYLYQYNQNISLITHPIFQVEKINLNEIGSWLKKQTPTIVFTFDPLARDIMLLARRKEKLTLGIITTCLRFYANTYWAADEGDLWITNLFENREQLIADFVNEKRIITIGSLIDYKKTKTAEKTVCRKKIGWPMRGFYIGIIADGFLPGVIEEFLERISAFPDNQLKIAVLSSDENLRQRIEEKSQSFLTTVQIFPIEKDMNQAYKALDLIIAAHDKVYLPEIFAQNLPSIIIAKNEKNKWSEGELDILNQKGLICKSMSLKDAVWQAEMIIKNKTLIKNMQQNLIKLKPPINPTDKIIKEIFSRMKKRK